MVAPRNREGLTGHRVRQLLDYDPFTGILRWRQLPAASRAVKVGDVAGSDDKGYVRIRVDRVTHYAHCLAWLWMTGAWPKEQIDHRNGKRADNRWANLREATALLNAQNRRTNQRHSRSGVLGVSQRRGGFVARICVSGKLRHLGDFPTAEAAHLAYVVAKRRLHGGCTL